MTEVLSKLSDELAATVEEAGKGVVRVESRRRLPASGIVWSSEGVVVTVHHAVEIEDKIVVGLPDGSSAAATLIGRDPTTDIAVLKAQAKGLNPASLAEPEGLRVGHLVLALGRPGVAPLATLGIVSALGDAWSTPLGGRVDRYLQTDVAMYPGFSGGPLVGVDGGVPGYQLVGAAPWNVRNCAGAHSPPGRRGAPVPWACPPRILGGWGSICSPARGNGARVRPGGRSARRNG